MRERLISRIRGLINETYCPVDVVLDRVSNEELMDILQELTIERYKQNGEDDEDQT